MLTKIIMAASVAASGSALQIETETTDAKAYLDGVYDSVVTAFDKAKDGTLTGYEAYDTLC